MAANNPRIKYKEAVGYIIDGLYNNGDYIEMDAPHFMRARGIVRNAREIDFLRKTAIATGLAEPVKEFDIDLGEYFNTTTLRLSDVGIIEMKAHGSFSEYWRKRSRTDWWKDKLTRLRGGWKEASEIAKESKVLIGFIITVVFGILLLTRQCTAPESEPKQTVPKDSIQNIGGV